MNADAEVVMNSSINYQLMEVNSGLMDTPPHGLDNGFMIENQDSFSERFEQLRGGMSFDALSEAVHRKTGKKISPQAMHKWSRGGRIDAKNVQVIAQFFGVKDVWLLYGLGDKSEMNLSDAVQSLPDESQQSTLDFIEYQIAKSKDYIASDKLASYMKMIDSIRHDMNVRRQGGK